MSSHDLHPAKRPAQPLNLLWAVLGGAMLLGLQACATTEMPQAKYPVYMQDKPAEAVATAAPEAAPVSTAPVISPASSGTVTTTELAPPPPPPPPAISTPPSAVATISAPRPAPATAPVRDARAAYVYTLVQHDTLYGVSRRFGVPVKTLYDINGFEPTATLRIGEKILLPEGAADKGTDEHANGPAMVRLTTALAAPAAPAKPTPAVVKPVPVATPPKPTVAQPTAVATATPKPAITSPAVKTPTQPTAPTTVAAAPTPGPSVTTTTTTTTTSATTRPATKPVITQPPVVAGFPANAQISQMGRGLFTWPVKGKVIVPFGQLAPNIRNDGINISAASGTEVRAAADGVVVYEGDQVKELGNTVYIKHPNGWYTGYSHLLTMGVNNNEMVKKGQVIGTVGETGTIDQPQLHFEVRYTPSTDIARPVDPTLVLP